MNSLQNQQYIGQNATLIQKPPGEIRTRMEDLDKSIQVLGEAWRFHCDKITSVIRTEPEPANDNVKEGPRPIASEHAEYIATLHRKVNQILESIQSVTQRVEL